MALYFNLYNYLLNEGISKELYRFQGAKSFRYFDFETNHFVSKANDSYVYFSASKRHHQYFVLLRLKQYIASVISTNTSYKLCQACIQIPDIYEKLKSLIISDIGMQYFESIRFLCDSSFYSLILNNCVSNSAKLRSNLVEKVDRIYGGGYGLPEEWLRLFEDMMFFSCYDKITVDDVLVLLHNMKVSRKISALNNLDVLGRLGRYQINTKIFDDFTKYNIMNDLEEIVEKNLCLNNDLLMKKPSKTIRTIINDYQQKRELILKKLDTNFNTFLEN